MHQDGHRGYRNPDKFRPTGGCITSTPKSADFSKKSRFSAKYERGFCMPRTKNGERPYLAVPEPGFLDPKIPGFRRILYPTLQPIYATTHLTFNSRSIQSTLGPWYASYTNTQLHQPNLQTLKTKNPNSICVVNDSWK